MYIPLALLFFTVMHVRFGRRKANIGCGLESDRHHSFLVIALGG